MSELHERARAMVADPERNSPYEHTSVIAELLDENERLSNERLESTLATLRRAEAAEAKLREPATFAPFWPPALRTGESYRVLCDDKGRNGGTWLDVFLANDGYVHVSMQDWEHVPDGKPDPWPSLRVRTYSGGGRNARTWQALLWLAEAIRLDTAPRPSTPS